MSKYHEDKDIHGKRRLPRNVVFSWGSQFIGIISGFIVPRLIGDSLGQDSLGIWDFCWSIVSYLGLVQGGIVSSINRFVATHYSIGDYDGLNQAVTSAAWVLRLMAVIVLLLAILLAFLAPKMLRQSQLAQGSHVSLLVLLLGTGVAVQLAGSVYSGILTGLHRWDIHNSIYAVTNLILFVGMFVVIKMGYGLLSLAVVHLACEGGGRLARGILVGRVFPEISINWKSFNKQVALDMLCFGGKNFTSYISQLLLNQTVNILIATQYGPAALAIYARPMSLIRNLTGVIQKFAMILTPTASSLYATGNRDELRNLYCDSLKFNLWFAIPILTLGFAYAKELMVAWMGPQYGDGTLLRIIILGFGGGIIHLPMLQILSGMNKHGKLAVINLVAAIMASLVAFAWVSINTAGGLVGLALCVSIPLIAVNYLIIPIIACREIGIAYWVFARKVYAPVVLSSMPVILMALVQILSGIRFGTTAGYFMIIGTVIAFFMISWLVIASAKLQNQISEKAASKWKRFFALAKL